jgi:arsenite methyltransferase
MTGLLDAALADPWTTLDRLVGGPLHPGGRAATAALLDRAGVGDGTRLVDVGCGAGAAVETARDRGADAWGIDRDPGTVRAVRGEATHLPFATGSVDVVLAECVLCLTDLGRTLDEVDRVLADEGRLAVSDVVVDPAGDPREEVPDAVADLLCLTGARSRSHLQTSLADAGFTVEGTRDHGEDLLAMRDRIAAQVDYVGLLSAMGERGRELQAGIERVEDAIDAGDVGYVSVVARV